MYVQLCKYVVRQRNDVFPPFFTVQAQAIVQLTRDSARGTGGHTFAHFLILQLHISISGALELG